MEDDYRKMMGLKIRAEAADVAKSQVSLVLSDIIAHVLLLDNAH